MKRKFYILTLLGVFFISTTGLPLTVSFCSMSASHSPKHCKMYKEMMKDHSCCSKVNNNNSVKLTLSGFACCQYKIVDHNITDQFLTSNNDHGSKTFVKILAAFSPVNYESHIISSQNIYTGGSPPPLLNNNIYLSNSILLI